MKVNFENILPSTIPFALLFFHETSYLGTKVIKFFSGSSYEESFKKSQVENPNNSCDMDLSQKEQNLIGNEEVEIVLKSLGMFYQPGEGEKLQGKLNSNDLFSLFEEDGPRLEEVKEAFEVFDLNRDGFIDADELQRVLLALGLKEGSEIENCRMMIRVFDENNDDLIDFQEFLRLMENVDC